MLKLAYCDYIAHVVKTAVNQAPEIPLKTTAVKMDLDEDSCFVSPKRILTIQDHNGKSYTITIEEAE